MARESQGEKLSWSKKLLFYTVMLLIPAFIIATIYIAYNVYEARSLYLHIKSGEQGWSVQVHQANPVLGFVPKPGISGAQYFSIGRDVPARFDDKGFRVPINDVNDLPINQHPTMLILGCSFTYGAAVNAEHTYAYKLGEYLGARTLNAGVCSYGLSQMVLLAEQLIPEHNPDYIIVQYSPWLVKRSISLFAPSYFATIPNPYFVKEGNTLHIEPPAFLANHWELPIQSYRQTPRGLFDFLSFYRNVGLPLVFHEHVNLTFYKSQRILGVKPSPARYRQRDEVIKYAYERIANTADKVGAKLVIVLLGRSIKPVRPSENIFPDNAMVVYAHDELLNRLTEKTEEAWLQAYGHWRGTPAKLVDRHPNEEAHRIIADQIVKHIKDNAGSHSINSTQ